MTACGITCHPRRFWLAALLPLALACGGSEATAPTTGSVRVTVATAGADLDPNGYTVVLDGDTVSGRAQTQPIALNGTVTFSQLTLGSHALALSDATANCLVAGANPRAVTVGAGLAAQITFQITCVPRVNVSGVWNYTEAFGSPLACNDTGSHVLTQGGDDLAGTTYQVGTCDQQAGSIDNSGSGPITGGVVYAASGSVSVNFSSGACVRTAQVAGTPPDRLINGTLQCAPGSGTWGAVRGGGVITSVAVSPPTRSVVAGGSAQLRAVLIDASGSRRVGPNVTWTSDASAVATVDPSGGLAGVAPGSATITAAAESKSGTATVGVEVVSFATVQAGAYHACGLTAGGAAYCWGHGTYGQIGEGAKASDLAPAAIADHLSLTAISVGALHSCGLTVSGAAYCWGLDHYSELGAGAPAAERCGLEGAGCSTTPIAVAGGRTFSSLSAGWVLSCALTASGTAYCWGDNASGGLGGGSTASTRTPLAVSGNLTFVTVGTGISFACGLTAAGAVYCWGNNSFGQLGIGATSPERCSSEPCSTTPVAVQGGLTFTALSVGYWHACGLASSGAAYCWGNNGDRQLGATTTETCAGFDTVLDCSTSPLPVEGGPTLARLSAGSFHTCGVTTGGNGYCWGANTNGQLGNGTTTASPTPAPIAGSLSFATLSAFGSWHSCGLSSAGVAYCWGYNGWGQVGDGTTFDAHAPVRVVGQAPGSGTGGAPLRASRVQRRTARAAALQPTARPRASRP